MDLTLYFDAKVIERVQKFSEDAKLKHIYGELRTATFNLNKANKYTHGHDNGLLKEATEQLKNARKDFLDRLDELEKSEQQRADAQAKDKYDSEILNLQKQMNDMTARSFKESKWTTYTAIAATLFAAVSLYLSWKQVSISERQNTLLEQQNQIMLTQNIIMEEQNDISKKQLEHKKPN